MRYGTAFDQGLSINNAKTCIEKLISNLVFVVYFCQAKGDRIPTTQSGSGKKQADKKQVDKKQADKKPAEKKPAEKKTAEKKQAEKKPAEKKPAEKKAADKKPADKKDKPGTKRYFYSSKFYTRIYKYCNTCTCFF